MNRLQGKVIVILGASAARSMGAATAKRFALEGAKLVLAARRREELQAVANEVGGEAFVADITQEKDLAALAEYAHTKHGSLDVAINYAGVNSAAPVLELTREALQQACDVHLIGAALFVKHMGARMKAGGSIITTSSLTALLAPPGLAAYAGTKRGADQIVRIAATELGPRGIRVNAIAPGFTRTEMTEAYFSIPTLADAFRREIPLGRLTSAEDVANAALWLATDESAATTGQVIDVTGGQSLRRTPTHAEMMAG